MRINLNLAGILLTLGMTSGLQPAFVSAQQATDNQSLQEQLDATNKGFTERMEQAVVQNIETAITELSATGILDKVKKVGDLAPDFTLPDATGKEVQLSSLLKQGPVVLTWYRGNW